MPLQTYDRAYLDVHSNSATIEDDKHLFLCCNPDWQVWVGVPYDMIAYGPPWWIAAG